MKAKQKRRGPSRTTGPGKVVGVRIVPDLMNKIDAWRMAQPGEPKPTRPETLRRLAEIALASAGDGPAVSKKTAAKASELAGREIERRIDPSAPDEEKAKRKRRLIEGPREFRDLRADISKRKR